ncbi:MAG: hypothetical protein F6J89_33225, partial [Symploca sp. SIO1C4]|nr:hypothetical protein [Symploca sp. SIO1C4]
AIPQVGPSTYLVGTVSGELIRYNSLSEFDYNDLSLDASVYQILTPRVYGRLGWRHQQLFSTNDGNRFLNNHALYLALGRRDRLESNLKLDTAYQVSLNFADPDTRSRLINALGTTLTYEVTPDLDASLGYQFNWVQFSEQDRRDVSHRVIATLSYQVSEGSTVSLFGGFRQGTSSEATIDFNGALFGAQWTVNLPLF